MTTSEKASLFNGLWVHCQGYRINFIFFKHRVEFLQFFVDICGLTSVCSKTARELLLSCKFYIIFSNTFTQGGGEGARAILPVLCTENNEVKVRMLYTDIIVSL